MSSSSVAQHEAVSYRQQQAYQRAADRFLSVQPLQPHIDVRPVATKYTHLPIGDALPPSTVPLLQYGTYNTHTTFNRGNDGAPWSGYAANVNVESDLRDQLKILQHCDRQEWVPSTHSDLYQFAWRDGHGPSLVRSTAHPFLNEPTVFNRASAKPNDALGYQLFNNCTRHQLKDTSAPHLP